MRHFRRLLRERLVVIGARGVRVQPQIELVLPAKFKPRTGEGVVPRARGGMPFGQVRRVRRDFIRNNPGLDIVLVRQPQMLLGGDIAEHRGAKPSDHRRANRPR